MTLEAFGPSARRPGDRMGIGYFSNGRSGPLEGLADPVVALGDVHGGEAYYNAAIAYRSKATDLRIFGPCWPMQNASSCAEQYECPKNRLASIFPSRAH